MKIQIDKKNNTEKGAISTLVAITVFMFATILLGVYLSITSLESAQLKSDIQIKKIYQDDVNKIDNVYAEVVGGYDNPYIPDGFIHTEGTWNSGYVIMELSTGNEFVWVPCVLEESSIKNEDTVVLFKKSLPQENQAYYEYNKSNLQLSDEESTASPIEKSVGLYGGFYIARYEAGIEGTTENASLQTKTATNGSVKPLSKANCGVWNYISRADAIKVSETMIDNDAEGLHSCLISGAAWDTTLQWITNASDNKDSNVNYDTNSTGKGWYNNLANNTRHLTGYYEVNNIYDIAGNVNEWTSENNNSNRVKRGGYFGTSGTDNPAASRIATSDATDDTTGFRVVMYKYLNNKNSLVSQITSANYGDSVAYSVTVNNVTLDNWKIFYNNGINVIMIYNDYLPNTTNLAADAGLTQGTGDYATYGVKSGTSRADLINKLNDKNMWTSLIRSDLTGKAIAKGAVDLDTWINSWNAKGYTKLYTKTISMEDGLDGFYIGTNENPTTYYQTVSDDVGYSDTLYFPYKESKNNCYGYWIASSSTYDTYRIIREYYTGQIHFSANAVNNYGICPVIYLDSSVLTSGKDASGVWHIE